jgi:hypothetical protein
MPTPTNASTMPRSRQYGTQKRYTSLLSHVLASLGIVPPHDLSSAAAWNTFKPTLLHVNE